MAQSIVWANRIFRDSTLIKGFWNDLLDADEDQTIDAMRRSQDGEALPANRFPSEFYVRHPGKSFKSFPEIFDAGGFWVVTGATAEVLRQFDLGQTSLYPTKFFKYDRKTPFERDFFCINFGEKKDAFVPELSTAVEKPWKGVDVWGMPVYPKDDQLAVSPAALEGVDLWMDPRLWKGLFLSDRLVLALRAAKLTRRFGLKKCRVLEKNQMH